MEYEFKRLSELEQHYFNQAISVFTNGFYSMFSKFLSKDKEKLSLFFKESFDPSMVFVYIQKDCVVAFLGLSDSKTCCVTLKKEICKKNFGNIKGAIVYKFMKSGLEKMTVFEKNEAHIAFFTTDPQLQGKSIGTLLIQSACKNLPYENYTLEVYSNNVKAQRLYTRLGFKEIKRTNSLPSRLFGYGAIIVMKLAAK